MANPTDFDKPDNPGLRTEKTSPVGSAEVVSTPTNPSPIQEQSTPMQTASADPSVVPQNITIINQVQGSGGVNPALLAASGRLKDKNPILAAILSLLIVGIGQFYNNQIGKGLLMMVGAIILVSATANEGGALLWFAVAVWSVVDAYRVAKQKRAIYTAAMASMQSGQQVANAGS